MLASPPDLLRLLAVPVFAWAAYRDVQTRRVPNLTWLPLAALGLLTLAWDVALVLDADPFVQRWFVVRVAVSLLLVAPMGYVFWRVGGFGGADAKAVMVLALLFPVYPVYYLPFDALPLTAAPLRVFSLTVLTNTVLLGLTYPLVLAAGNLARGRVAPAMFVGRPVPVRTVTEEYGRLLETPAGFTRGGLDLDALRMYLRWRGTSLAAVRANPAKYRDPASLPDERCDPTDGALADGGRPLDAEPDAGADARPDAGSAPDATAERTTGGGSVAVEGPAAAPAADADAWGAATFLAEIEGSAYGTTPDQLRAGLELLATADRDAVWLTPGIPFVVPMFLGLVVGLVYGDILYGAFALLGLA